MHGISAHLSGSQQYCTGAPDANAAPCIPCIPCCSHAGIRMGRTKVTPRLNSSAQAAAVLTTAPPPSMSEADCKRFVRNCLKQFLPKTIYTAFTGDLLFKLCEHSHRVCRIESQLHMHSQSPMHTSTCRQQRLRHSSCLLLHWTRPPHSRQAGGRLWHPQGYG
jgi:hypothetical protein